jgi:hypothetical protein
MLLVWNIPCQWREVPWPSGSWLFTFTTRRSPVLHSISGPGNWPYFLG